MNYKLKEYNSQTLRDYATDFIKYDTICTQAPMASGKTKQLLDLLKLKEYKNKKIIIVSFRRSLLREYKQKLPNFSYYTEIKDRKIDLDTHRKLIIQADSLYRIRGNSDMLVMDECTYTLEHMVTYVKKFKTQCVGALEHLISTSEKVLAIDALFNEDYVNIIAQYRENIIYTRNNYKLHNNKMVTMYGNDMQSFYNKMMESLRKKEKIVICTNSKMKLNYFEDKIRKEFNNLNCMFIDCETEKFKIEDWANMDVVGYTPTITAGVSFEKEHFDRCFGYFVSGSSNAALSIQQLFRIRNLNKNQYNICVDVTTQMNYPVEFEDLDNTIENKNECLVDGHEILDLDYGKKVVNKDNYYYMYRTVLKYNNMSKNNYQQEMVRLLKTQGITNIITTGKKNKDLNKILRNDYRTFKEMKEEQNSCSVVESDDIDAELYHDLVNKENLKRNEKNSILKYSFLDQTKIKKEKLTPNTYREYKPKLNQFHNLAFLKNNKNNLENVINKHIAYNDYSKRDGKSIEILHKSKKYEKIKILNNTVKALGWKDLNDTESIDMKINYDVLIPILKKIEAIFSTSIHKWNTKEKNNRTATIRYINSRLSNTFDMTMSYDKISKRYSLKTISQWDFMHENFEEIKNVLDTKEINFDDNVSIDLSVYKLANDMLPEPENETVFETEKQEIEIQYFKPDHMDYIELYKAKNKNHRNNKVKPNRRIKVYRDKHRNKHKGPGFMIEEIEKWDKEGTIHENMGDIYEDQDIEWEDPNYKKETSDKKSLEMMFEMFDLYDVNFHPTEKAENRYNGYTKDDLLALGREQLTKDIKTDICDSDSEEEAEYDLY